MFEDFPLFPERASTIASDVDALYLALVAFSALFTFGIFVAILYFSIRYRRRSEDEIPLFTPPQHRLEVLWTVVPFAISFGLLVWGMDVYMTFYDPPSDAVEVTVVARQWMWKFQHPGGQAEIDELHVALGSRVMVRLASEDVIHSFFVPAFRVKQDAVPGRYTRIWFEATRVGEYHLFCAEYCGSKHSRMVGKVVVMEPDDFQERLRRNEPAETPVSAGARLFAQHGCDSCHRERDGRRGPSLAGLHDSEVRLANGDRVKADYDYLRESIVDPSAKNVVGFRNLMPVYRGRLSEENILRILDYIKSLPPDANASRSASSR
ncbi:MAG: cytochrome c oxidase subunit II [Vicinamibacteria bacterium]